jgi:hypothetical protein
VQYGNQPPPPSYSYNSYTPPQPIHGYQATHVNTGWQPGVGYAQTNANFLYSNVPPPTQLAPLTGKRKALLIGINCMLCYIRIFFSFSPL